MNCKCSRDDQRIDVIDIEMTDDGFQWIEWCGRCGEGVRKSIAVDWQSAEETG